MAGGVDHRSIVARGGQEWRIAWQSSHVAEKHPDAACLMRAASTPFLRKRVFELAFPFGTKGARSARGMALCRAKANGYDALDSPAAVRARPPKRRAKLCRIRISRLASCISWRSEERRVGKEGRSRWSAEH